MRVDEVLDADYVVLEPRHRGQKVGISVLKDGLDGLNSYSVFVVAPYGDMDDFVGLLEGGRVFPNIDHLEVASGLGCSWPRHFITFFTYLEWDRVVNAVENIFRRLDSQK